MWIFVRKATTAGQPPVSYFVAPDHRVRALRASVKQAGFRRIEKEFDAVHADELPNAVSNCSSAEQNYRRGTDTPPATNAGA